MHFHAEIVIPPTAENEIEGKLRDMLAPFNENNEESSNTFFDYWVLGGRWSGAKIKAKLGRQAIDEFYSWLQERKTTVSSFTAGKQTLRPTNQAAEIDAEWSRRFPEFAGHCPLFDHYRGTNMDICAVNDIPPSLECETLVIAAPHWEDCSRLEANGLQHGEIWNGVEHQKTMFDGNVAKAITAYNEKIAKRYKEGVQGNYLVRSDWLCITVDYHR